MINRINNKIKYELFNLWCPYILKMYNYTICDKIYGVPRVSSIDETLDKLLSGEGFYQSIW